MRTTYVDPSSPAHPAPARETRPNLSPLTGLRFLAALAVVAYHLPRPHVAAWALPLRSLLSCGFVAVSLFFLLSGFILAYTYLTPAGALRGSPRNFWVSRFARIYPAYLLAFLLAAPFDILSSLHVNGFHLALKKLCVGGFLVLIMQQAWTPWTAWAWNYPAWSVSVEAFFYLVFPWLGPRLARLRAATALWFAFGLWLLSLLPVLWLVWVRGVTGSPDPGDPVAMAINFTPLLRLPEFILGILLGRAFTAGAFRRLRAHSLPWLAIVPLFVLFLNTRRIPHSLLATGLLVPLFGLLLITLAQDAGPIAALLSRPWMRALGEASYGIYILQIPISLVFGVPEHLHSGLRIGLYMVALILLSLLSFHYIESPLRMRLKARLGVPRDLERSPGQFVPPTAAASVESA